MARIEGQEVLTTREEQKCAVIACLRSNPDFNALAILLERPAGELQWLLRWIDESGLAIYLLRLLSANDLLETLNPWFRSALTEREEANRQRTRRMLDEFARINDALKKTRADYAVIKGFSLSGEFCSEPWVRHQCDTDLLVTPQALPAVRSALVSLGYKVESADASGEVCLAIRSAHIPSSEDYLYSEPPHWHVEIHPMFYEPIWGVSLGIGEDWARRIEWREIDGIRYPSLGRAYRFLGQVLHVFRHTSTWIRLSWLYEISYFAEKFRDDSELWAEITQITNGDVKSRNACGVVCSMVRDTFGTPLPRVLQENWIDSLSLRQQRWLIQYGPQMMLNDFTSGDKVGLLLQRGFADSTWTWWKSRSGRYMKFVRSMRKGQHEGPLFIAERARRQVSYLWRCLLWNLEKKSARPDAPQEP